MGMYYDELSGYICSFYVLFPTIFFLVLPLYGSAMIVLTLFVEIHCVTVLGLLIFN